MTIETGLTSLQPTMIQRIAEAMVGSIPFIHLQSEIDRAEAQGLTVEELRDLEDKKK